MHIMVDIETLDNNPTAAVLSIGAVAIDNGQIVSEFYRPIGLLNAIPYGTVNQSTYDWWMKQSEEARKEAFYPEFPVSTRQAARDFCDWALSQGPALWWSNGSDFDLVVLKQWYQNLGIETPWGFRDIRCYRTLRNLLPWVKAPHTEGIAHNALADARYQGNHLALLLAAMPTV